VKQLHEKQKKEITETGNRPERLNKWPDKVLGLDAEFAQDIDPAKYPILFETFRNSQIGQPALDLELAISRCFYDTTPEESVLTPEQWHFVRNNVDQRMLTDEDFEYDDEKAEEDRVFQLFIGTWPLPIPTEDEILQRFESELHMYADGILRTINHAVTNQPEAMVFLDKSARPVAHLFRHLWKDVFSGQAMPSIYFVSFGRENHDLGEDGAVEKFVAEAQKHLPQLARMKQISIVDETTASGGSLGNAKYTLARAFPNLTKIDAIEAFDDEPAWVHQEHLSNLTDDTTYELGLSMVSKSQQAIIRNPELMALLSTETQALLIKEASGSTQNANKVRKELEGLAHIISKHIVTADLPPVPYQAYVNPKSDEFFKEEVGFHLNDPVDVFRSALSMT